MRYIFHRFRSLSKDDVGTLAMAWLICTLSTVLAVLVIGLAGVPVGIAVAILIFIAGGML